MRRLSFTSTFHADPDVVIKKGEGSTPECICHIPSLAYLGDAEGVLVLGREQAGGGPPQLTEELHQRLQQPVIEERKALASHLLTGVQGRNAAVREREGTNIYWCNV